MEVAITLVSVLVGAVLSWGIQAAFSRREHKRHLRMIQFETLHDFTAELRVASRNFQLELSRSANPGLGEPSEEVIDKYFQVTELGIERVSIATVDRDVEEHISSARKILKIITDARFSWGSMGLENKGRNRMIQQSGKLLREVEEAVSVARDSATR